jgi:uncharacterized RDD family membrane protein YckC
MVVAVFFCGFWVAGGQTLGMRSWRLRVQRRDGRPIGWWQALGRFLLAIPALALGGIGLWWMLVDRDRLALHDRLSRTRAGGDPEVAFSGSCASATTRRRRTPPRGAAR